MTWISERDWQAVRAVALEIGARPFDASAVEEVTRCIARLIPAEACAFNAVDLVGGAVRLVSAPEFPQYEEYVPHLAETMGDHPLIQRWAQPEAVLDPCRVSDVISGTQWRRTSTYGQVLGPMGVDHMLAIPLRFDEGYGEGYALVRSSHDFTEAERDLARLLQLTLVALHGRAMSQPSREGLLTPREQAVLSELSAGVSTQVVARRLSISRRTVEKHAENAYRKLGVGDRVSAINAVRERGLLVS